MSIASFTLAIALTKVVSVEVPVAASTAVITLLISPVAEVSERFKEPVEPSIASAIVPNAASRANSLSAPPASAADETVLTMATIFCAAASTSLAASKFVVSKGLNVDKSISSSIPSAA